MVTVRSEPVDFHAPVRVGQMAGLTARVAATGRSPMRVEISLVVEDPLSGARQLCTRGHFMMVALDEHGRGVALRAAELAATD